MYALPPFPAPLRTLAAVVVCSLCSLFAVTSAASAATRPPVRGAVKLKPANLRKVGKVRCGRIHARWWPGTRLPKGYFVTHSQQSRNFARRARLAQGATRRSYRREAAAFRAKAKHQLAICRRKKPTAPAPVAPAPVVPAPQVKPLRFSLAGAAGLALGSTTTSRATTRQAATTGSNLNVVTPAGDVVPATTSGTATVRKFLIAPDGKVYVEFVTRVNLANTATYAANGCLLAVVDRDTGVPTCIDATLNQIGTSGIGGSSVNPWIQFDGSGAIYYAGHTSDGKTVLRKYADGTTTDLINDNVTVDDFLVLPDGGVILSGLTQSTQTQWVRRITPQGGLQTLAATRGTFLRMFPDNNVYFGVWGPDDLGIKRFLATTNQVETKYWITGDMGVVRDGYFKVEDYCSGDDGTVRASFCGNYGTYDASWFRTTDGRMYGVAGGGSQRGLLTEFYPTLAFPQTEVTDVKVAQGVVTNLILAGQNAAHQNVMTIFNTSNDTETDLIGPDNEIEIYHVNYVAADNKVMFDGLRFADNKYVLGEVDLNTQRVSVATTLGAKWADFQTFG